MKRAMCLILMCMLSTACKKPYNPPAVNAVNSYMVVEGVINAGSDSTVIKLSRTVNVSSAVTTNAVTGAAVTVESDANNVYGLTETGGGNYTAAALNLDKSLKYRLRIKTNDSKEYLSDFVSVDYTPPIDSVGFIVDGSKLNIYVNSHNAANTTRYYRWDYQEAWQFHSKYESTSISNGTKIVLRNSDQYIYYCFTNDVSNVIVLGSSAKLAQDVIYQNPITSIASTSEKIEKRYSILIREYALTASAFNFWTSLKKNTEQLGSIFDAQPSQLAGNIHNINDPAEPVIGYISAENVESKRIFIDNAQLPVTWQPDYPYNCELDTFWYSNPHTGQNEVAEQLIPLSTSYLPVIPFGSPGIAGYLGSAIDCIDCTIRGTKTAPPFWKY